MSTPVNVTPFELTPGSCPPANADTVPKRKACPAKRAPAAKRAKREDHVGASDIIHVFTPLSTGEFVPFSKTSCVRFSCPMISHGECKELMSQLVPFTVQRMFHVVEKGENSFILYGVLHLVAGNNWKIVRDLMPSDKTYTVFGPYFTSEPKPLIKPAADATEQLLGL